MTQRRETWAMLFAVSMLAGGCGAERGDPSLPGACVSGQPGCFGGDDAAQGTTTWGEVDEDSGSADDPLPPADDGDSDGPAADTGSGPADIPDDDRPGDDDGATQECGAAYESCLEDGGNLVSCFPLFEDCSDGGSDGGGSGEPGDYPDCCDEIASTCGEGPPDSTCGAVEEVCESGDCAALPDLCPPGDIPVSEECALAYRACFPGFAVNNCVRVLYETCVAYVGDAEFCGEREEACDVRIAYCQELLGPGNASFISCAEQGPYFDACWDSLGCAAGEPGCTSAALLECAGPGQGVCSPAL